MVLDIGINFLTHFHAEHMASRKVDIKVSDENLSKPRVQDIIDLVNNQPKHDDHDLETKDAIWHQSIGNFKELKSRVIYARIRVRY